MQAQRERIVVQGIVQGVGFRPFVYGLATGLDLAGFVRNDSAGVTIEVEGGHSDLETFIAALRSDPPPLAQIDAVLTERIPPQGETTFTIQHSQPGASRQALISPDVAMCADCESELLDPADRRFWYPFINCTNCGPRFTIIQDVPYDRDQTTMQVFTMCADCQSEYRDPRHRRFHAQPNACPKCGPAIRLAASSTSDERNLPSDTRTLFLQVARQLLQGQIIAVKGLGGYHLACDALNVEAVGRLRARKQREAKPFALLVPDIETANQVCLIDAAEASLLQSRRRPIVLLRRRPGQPLAAQIAPGVNTLGLMLPYTPLHFLLLQAVMELAGASRPTVLVLTSGNLSDEPIAYRDADAFARLSRVADGWLVHNRPIHIRCDDSVARVAAGGEQIFRRSRGYVPDPIRLANSFPVHLLACGGHLKNTFCLGKENLAFLSHHIGDLENLETLTSFEEGITHFERLFDIQPRAVAYDLHPDYLSTKYALGLDLPYKLGVQHHHAHIASVLAEHGLSGPVIGVAADGSGYGTDGAVWGGEVLVAGLEGFERAAHLAYVPLPGGEQAVRQPWRMAAVYLQRAFGEDFLSLDIPFVRRMDVGRWKTLAQMIAKGVNSPLTSSLGRLFDAVAALVGVRGEAAYEGQAAIELEAQAALLTPIPNQPGYPFAIHAGAPAQMDVRPTIRALVADLQQGVDLATISARFHRAIAEMLAQACCLERERSGLAQVALSGGVFQNRLLLEQLVEILQNQNFQVYINRKVPPNDGGLALGQAAIAAAVFKHELRS